MGSLHGAIRRDLYYVISGLGVYVSDVWATPCSHVGQLKTCLAVDPSGARVQALGCADAVYYASKQRKAANKRWRGKQCLLASKQAYGTELN